MLAITGSNWSLVAELCIYRSATLISTRTLNRSGNASGTQRFPIADTYVDTAPATASVSYQVRAIVTTDSNITSATVINRNLNIITFTP